MKLNGLEIPTPKERIKVEPVELGKSDRTASGRRVKDIKGIKNNYILSYQGLKASSMKIFKDVYLSGEAVPFEYENFEGNQSVVININSLPYSISKQNSALSQSITITLEEV